jgi:hypothetical protein
LGLFGLAASLLSGGQPILHPNQGLSLLSFSPPPIGAAKKYKNLKKKRIKNGWFYN